MSQAEALAYAGRLSRILARQMRLDFDDARQIAHLATLRALASWDGRRKLRSLVRVCVRNALIDEYHREGYRVHLELFDCATDSRTENIALARELLSGLSARERRIVEGWLAGELDTEQAERIGRHFTIVSRSRSAALAKMREVA